jgi:hypothetical protein
MQSSFDALTLALAALQDTGVPKTSLQIDAINSLREAIQTEKDAPKHVPLHYVIDCLMQHHALVAGQHSHYRHAADMIKMTFQ